jgi:hypothetical protein
VPRCRFWACSFVEKVEDRMRAHATIEIDGVSRPRVFRCGVCGTSHGEPAWRLLPLVGHLEAREVRALVSHWPDGVRIEIRKCRCGRTMAVKRPTGGA